MRPISVGSVALLSASDRTLACNGDRTCRARVRLLLTYGDVVLAHGSSEDLTLGESGQWRSDASGHEKAAQGALWK